MAKAGQRQRAEPERRLLEPLAAHRDVALRLAQQPPLQEHERRRHGDDRHHHHRHQLIGRHAELVGELVEVGREHQQALRVAEHERQAEQFEAEEEHQHAGEQDRRQHHRQAHVDRDLQRVGAGDARGLLEVGAEPAQRRRRVEVDVRHVGQAGDDDERGERVEVPRHEADQRLDRGRKESRPARAPPRSRRRSPPRRRRSGSGSPARASGGPARRCAPSGRRARRRAAPRSPPCRPRSTNVVTKAFQKSSSVSTNA